MTRLALKNPLAILMACIAVIVFAGVVTPRMSVDTFPELTPPVLVVGTLAPGLGPKDVEKTLTWRIEKYVSATPGVDHVESSSRNNLSVVYVWFKWGTDLNAAQGLVQQQVAFAMSAVPKSLGVLPPFVLQYDPSNAPVVQVAVYGGGLSGPQLYDYAQNEIEPQLESIEGVASASPNGGRQRQINVVVDPVRAAARGVTTSEIAAAINNANALLPSGKFITKAFDANVYTNAIAKAPRDMGDAPVKEIDGRPVLIRDVARIEDGGSPPTQTVAINGQDAVYLNVLRVPGGNTLKIVDTVKQKISDMQAKLPPGLVVKPVFDQSTFVRTTYKGLQREIVQALVLIALVILLFLQNARTVLIAAIAIPISFAIILIVLASTGQTLNAFTLGGLTLAMGPLVDISVVVLESIHRARHHGRDAADAALHGANEVALPALAATLTTVAVLLPVVLLYGLAKKLFGPLALTVATAMFAGYFVSMMVTPVACRYFLKDKPPGRIAAAVGNAVARVASGYARVLRAVLPWRTVVIGACIVLVAGSVYAAGKLPSTFFPEIDEGMERLYVRLAPGTSLEDSTKLINEIGKTLQDDLPKGAVDLVLTNVGSPLNPRSAMNSPNAGPHMGFIRLELVDPDARRYSQQEIADMSREIVRKKFPGVEVLQWPGGLVASVFSNGYNAPIVVEVPGEDLEELARDEQAIGEVARTVPGMRDIYPTIENDYPEVRVNLDRQVAGEVGVSARQAAQSTLEATFGNINTPGVWVDSSNGNAYYVVTSYDGRQVADPTELGMLPVKIASSGAAVALGQYADIFRSSGPILVERNHLERVAHVYMQVEGRDIGSAAAELEQKLAKDPRTRGLHTRFVGQVQLMRETFGGLGIAIGLAVMVVFMIMASQFKSLRLPMIMLFTVPCTLIGIVLALLAAGQGFSVIALMGVLMVVGISVSNGILLVDHAARLYDRGEDKIEAVIDAARTRFVPILMTSLATIIGLLPTALALEKGTEANQPLALAVVGGLASSTVLSLFLVPSMFLVLARRRAVTPTATLIPAHEIAADEVPLT
jgi:CzcA family heavy metal efflux pump